MIYMLNTKYKGKLFYSLFYLYYSAINTNPARPSIYLIRMHIGHETIASVSLPLSRMILPTAKQRHVEEVVDF